MIFGAVGTNSWDFTRLIKELDEISGEIDEKMIIQIGNNNYKPKNAQFFEFIDKNEMEDIYEESRVIVSHAGIGIILSAIRHKKPIIVVPRMEKFGEHFDNHQIDTAKKLEKEGITVAWDIEQLKLLLMDEELDNTFKSNNELTKNLKNYIDELEKV